MNVKPKLSAQNIVSGVVFSVVGIAVGVAVSNTSEKNATLVASLIGGAVATIGGTLASYMTVLKDREQWERQQEVERLKRETEDSQKVKEGLKEAYLNSLHYTSLLINELSQNPPVDNNGTEARGPISEAERTYRAAAHKWAHTLLLNLALKEAEKIDANEVFYFNEALQEFVGDDPYKMSNERGQAERFRGATVALKDADWRLKGAPPNANAPLEANTSRDTTLKKLTLNLDSNFRQQQLVAGVELPAQFLIECRLEAMTSRQRAILNDCYFQHHEGLPKEMRLNMPFYASAHRKILPSHSSWKARINPLTSTPEQILSSWESDYEQALAQANEQANQGSPPTTPNPAQPPQQQ